MDLRRRQRLSALATLLLSLLVAATLLLAEPVAWWLRPVGWAFAGVLLFVALRLGSSALGPGTPKALLPLNWFLPFLRKRRKDVTYPPPSWSLWAARRIFPDSWFADHDKGRPGRFRRLLKKIGPSAYSAPLRRVIQGSFLALYLILFFYVCWPYTAAPEPPGKVSPGWRVAQVDQQTGNFHLQGGRPAAWLEPGALPRFLVSDDGANEAESTAMLRVVESGPAGLILQPIEPLTAEQFDAIVLSASEWSIHQREPNAWPSHYADELASKEQFPADFFLAIDPLVSLSTAVAARSWVWSLACAAAILIVCLVIPRGFCGYVCPLGTVIDLFDWGVTSRVSRFRVSGDGWWVHIKYYLLAATLLCAVAGVLVSGFVAAIPVITRAMLMIGEPLASGTLRGWHLVPPPNIGQIISIAMFLVILCLGFMRPRFWCKYVCPSGAVFSVGNLFRVTERKVESSCINCNRCVEVCPFDAIKPDFTTRGTDCTLCQTCGGVCPTHAIKFVERWNGYELKVLNDPPTGETALGRRGFLSLAAGSTAAAVGGLTAAGAIRGMSADLDDPAAFRPVRPPGSVPEAAFLDMCIRCGECFKVCPNNVLQPEAFEQGWDGLWTPMVKADWAGCESSCNACGQVCPTGAIRELPLAEKRFARMGLAIVNESTCLPFAGREACDLCVKECQAAGYDAIEYTQVHTQVDEEGLPIAGTGYLAPVVLDDKCVGCGLCQTRCYGINVKSKHLLDASAIVVEAGPGKEDRMLTGSYRELRRQEAERRRRQQRSSQSESYFIPGESPRAESVQVDDDPFGLGMPPDDAGEAIDISENPF